MLPVGEFKTHFSAVLDKVIAGEEVIISYGKKKEPVAVLVPYSSHKKQNSIKLGLLRDKKMKITDDFAITEEELLNL